MAVMSPAQICGNYRLIQHSSLNWYELPLNIISSWNWRKTATNMLRPLGWFKACLEMSWVFSCLIVGLVFRNVGKITVWAVNCVAILGLAGEQ